MFDSRDNYADKHVWRTMPALLIAYKAAYATDLYRPVPSCITGRSVVVYKILDILNASKRICIIKTLLILPAFR